MSQSGPVQGSILILDNVIHVDVEGPGFRTALEWDGVRVLGYRVRNPLLIISINNGGRILTAPGVAVVSERVRPRCIGLAGVPTVIMPFKGMDLIGSNLVPSIAPDGFKIPLVPLWILVG